MSYVPTPEQTAFYDAMALYFDDSITFEEFTTIVEDLSNENN